MARVDEIRAHLEIQEAIQSIPQQSPHVVLRAEGWPLVRPWVWFKDYEGPKEGAEFQCTKCGERGRYDQLWLSEKKIHTGGVSPARADSLRPYGAAFVSGIRRPFPRAVNKINAKCFSAFAASLVLRLYESK